MYKPETPFQIEDSLVYNLTQQGWNDVEVRIEARHLSEEVKQEIVQVICAALNERFPVDVTEQLG
jgi:type VI protein secretion system component VasK